MWRARRLGYSTEEALEEITTFQKFVSKAEQVQVPESSSHPSASAKMKNYLGGTCSGISEAEREAERISLASQIRMDLQQLMKAIGILYYPNLSTSLCDKFSIIFKYFSLKTCYLKLFIKYTIKN